MCLYLLPGPDLAESRKVYVMFHCHSFKIFFITNIVIPMLMSSATCESLRNVLPNLQILYGFCSSLPEDSH